MISLITSIYKPGKYLKKYIFEVNNFNKQLKKYQIPFELIIILNNGDNKEKNLLNNLAVDIDKKIINIPLESLYSSWNRGVAIAKYKIIGFWNVDDIRTSDAILDGIKYINKGYKLVYFPFIYKRYIKILNFSLLVKKKIIKPPQFDKIKFSKEMHCGPFFLFTKELYDYMGKFDENFKIAGDFDWCSRAASKINFKLSDTIAGTFINEGVSLSGSKNDLQKKENNMIYNKNI